MERLIDVKDFPEDCEGRIIQYINFLSGCYFTGVIDESIDDFNTQFKAWNSSTGYTGGWGNKGFPTDFHLGNVMLRPDGTAVFIDPIYNDMKTKSQKIAEEQARAEEVDSFFIPSLADILPAARVYREQRVLGANPGFKLDFAEPEPKQYKQVICKGKPHAVFIDHNIKRFKRK